MQKKNNVRTRVNISKQKNIIAFVVGALTTLLFLLQVSPVMAERLESSSYVIQFGNFNITSGEKSSSSYNVTDTVGQTGAGPFGTYGGTNYFVGSGFQYIYQTDSFSFSLSKNDIDLGVLAPGVHNTDTHTMTVTSQGAGGYTVTAYETQPLTHTNTVDTIPDTTCDDSTCTYITAGVWADQSIPGFGYTIEGDDIPTAFIDTSYFKAFADNSQGQTPQEVMGSASIASPRTATVTFNVGIDQFQAAGNYQTDIVYTALPGF